MYVPASSYNRRLAAVVRVVAGWGTPAMVVRVWARTRRTAGARGPGAASSRGPVAGVKGTQHCSFG